MKYIVMDEPKKEYGDAYTKEYDTLDEAIREAEYEAAHKAKDRTISVLESVNPDESAEDHFDGNIVWKKEE